MDWDKATSEIIENIFANVDSQQGWAPVLEMIARYFNAGCAYLSCRNPVTGETIEDSGRNSTKETSMAEGQSLLLSAPAQVAATKYPIIDTSEGSEQNSIFCSEIAESGNITVQRGLPCRMTSVLRGDKHWIIGVAITCPRPGTSFSGRDVARLEYLLPHMLSAVRLKQKVRRLERDLADVVSGLDRIPLAAMIVTAELKLVCHNRQAERLLANSDILSVCRGKLVSERMSESSALRNLVGEAAAQADNIVNVALESLDIVSVSRPKKLPLEVLAVPLRQGHLKHHQTGGSARVLLMFYDPGFFPRVDPAILERFFGLTFTEAVIAARLAEGCSIADIARKRRCSASTVRTHVKNIFQKTHTKRQGELVQMLLTSPAVSFLV